jgi:hypothetical protein
MTARGDRVNAVDAGNKYCSNFGVKLQNTPSIKPYSSLAKKGCRAGAGILGVLCSGIFAMG